MTKLYGVLTQVCGSLAIALLVIALTTAGARDAFADPLPVEECACTVDETLEECEARCLAAGPCNVTCGGSYPQCGTGTCNAQPACTATCTLILAGSYKACECKQ